MVFPITPVPVPKDPLPPEGPYGPPSAWASQTAREKAEKEKEIAYQKRLDDQTRGAEALIFGNVTLPSKKKDIEIFKALKFNTVIKYNPPAIAYASGAAAYALQRLEYLPFEGSEEAGFEVVSKRDKDGLWRPFARDDVLNSGSQSERLTMKGSLIPDVNFIDDWLQDPSDVGEIESFDLRAKKTVLDRQGEGFVLYGFRFPFNPASLDFQISSTTNVNIGYVLAGSSTAMPTGLSTVASSINFQIPLSRVDDMMAIRKLNVIKDGYGGGVVTATQGIAYTVKDVGRLYGMDGTYSGVTSDDLEGIVQRGTMYDIEYLLRTCLGKPLDTVYRGKTADVGLLFGVPLVLTLGSLDGKYRGGMRYRVRLAGVSYTHKSFTPNMVPLYTELNLSFERIPDVKPKAYLKPEGYL